MTPEKFLEEFGTIANAPGGTKRLRELILQLAIQGKLVEQNPEDEPAIEFLKKIRKPIDLSRNEKEQQDSNNRNDKFTFAAPKGWLWCKLGEISSLIRGVSYSKKDAIETIQDSYVELLRANNIQIELEFWNTLFVPREMVKAEQMLKNGDILIAMSSGSPHLVGKAIQFHGCREATFGAFCAVIRALDSSVCDYLNFYTSTPFYRMQTQKEGKGIGIQNLNQAALANLAIPIPPFAEQKRIVAKVDQLMALCDKLEQQQKDRSKFIAGARISALEKLSNAQDSNEIASAWQRVNKNLHLFFEKPEDVEDLKKCILQNAVMGKLVPQNPDDEPASELLKKIAAEKAELIKKGEIKKEKPLPPIREDEKPFKIPDTWEWVRFYQINSIQSEIVSSRDFPDSYQIGPDLIEKGIGKLTGRRTVEESGCIGPNNRFYSGQILYSKIRPSLNKAVIAPYDGLCSSDMYPIKTFMLSEFMLTYILSISFLEQVKIAENRVKMPKLNLDSLNSFVVAMPNFAEQQRIVNKSKYILKICERLQKQLENSKFIAGQLANSVVESLTGISTEKKEAMKAPKTELITKLVLMKKPTAKDHAPLSAILSRNNDSLSAKALWNASGLAIDDFYKQLKTEMLSGYIDEPEKAVVKIIEEKAAEA